MTPTIYTEADLRAIRKQISKRWLLFNLPTAVFLAVILGSFAARLAWLTSTATILAGVMLIAGYDLAIKPLNCYHRHLENCLHGRTRDCELPFVRLSDEVEMVDGVRCHLLLCLDVDAKGRPCERPFYFDAEKQFPPAQKGDMMHIVHHDLRVANIYPL